jgi:hypothetical protein
MSEKVDKAWLNVARSAGQQDRDMEVHGLRAEIKRLRDDLTMARSERNSARATLRWVREYSNDPGVVKKVCRALGEKP